MDATLGLPALIGLIAVAVLFDFLNGLHDAANSIATVVGFAPLTGHDGGIHGAVLVMHAERI